MCGSKYNCNFDCLLGLNKIFKTNPISFPQMPSSLTLLQNTLDDLQQDEFKRFKSCLKDFKLNGCRSIARCHLEDNKSRTDVADSMTKHYEEETLNVTRQILERIGHNELAGQLKSDMGK